MPTPFARPHAAWLFLILLSPEATADDRGRFDAGARLRLGLASGVPANDMPGYGLYGIYRINDVWSVGLSVDQLKFDYEEPAKRLGIPVDPDDPPLDPKVDQTIVGVSVQHSFTPAEASREWFLGGELAMAFTDVPVVAGTSATGEPFEIHTEVDRELIASLLGGVRQRFGESWFVEFALRADQHFAAWEPVDQVSGAEARHDDYFAYGFHLGVGYRF
jgi:hypothetical protein